jgi:DHA3 family tetracycline resistance protein-like MFS transporter
VPGYPAYLLFCSLRGFALSTAFTLNLVYQIQTVGLGPLQLILVGTVLESTCLLAQVPTGVIADLRSRKLSMVLGCLLVGAGVLLEGAVPALFAVLAGNVVWGVGATCIDGAEEAWVADELGVAAAGRAFTRGSQLGRVGSVLGVGASVALASVRLNLPLLAGGALLLCVGLLLAVALPERHFRPAGRTGFAAVRGQVVAGVHAVRRRPVLVRLLAATVLIGIAAEGMDRLGQAHFLADLAFPAHGTPVLWFGGFAVAATLGSIGINQAVRRRTDALDPDGAARLLVGFEGAVAVAVAVFALAGAFWLAATAYLAVGMLRAATYPLVSTWLVARTEPATRATVFSLAGQADAAGQVVGGLPVGYLGSRLGIRAALLAVGVLLLPAVALLHQTTRGPRCEAGAGPGRAGRGQGRYGA